jgi:DNA-binding PadR family transcriptional regulator
MRWLWTTRKEREATVLRLLGGGRGMYGLDMMRESGGVLARWSLYTTLGRMEDEDLIEGREVTNEVFWMALPRRLYRITDLGRFRLADLEGSS